MSTGDEYCFFCRAGHCNECEQAWADSFAQDCCCGGKLVFTPTGEVKEAGVVSLSDTASSTDTGYIEDGYGGTKDIGSYKDPISTGRKRAAEMYPIEVGMICEWANLKFAGGGVVPIVGCIGRAATDRHHGPDKNTMNNALGNVHRICSYCHNTWHGANDPHYGERPNQTLPFVPDGPYESHDAVTKATTQELLDAEKRRVEDATK
jgi:hypothetical protein